MVATVDEAGAIEAFIAPGLTPHERRHMAAWPHGLGLTRLCGAPHSSFNFSIDPA